MPKEILVKRGEEDLPGVQLSQMIRNGEIPMVKMSDWLLAA